MLQTFNKDVGLSWRLFLLHGPTSHTKPQTGGMGLWADLEGVIRNCSLDTSKHATLY